MTVLGAAPWSLRGLVSDLASGRTTVEVAHERAQRRIAQTEPEAQAWVTVASEPQRPASGPLAGAPLGVKDIIDVAGMPTRCGSALRADAGPAPADAAVVAAWRRAGAVPIGKTVTTEFAFFAPGPTQNPAAPGHTPGGSSSGSAAAVAAGQVPVAIGSQTAGSVTRPASYCGVAALVTGRGRLPLTGVVGLSPTLDTHGIFAAGVSDLGLAWSALTGGPDSLAVPPRAPHLLLWTADAFDVVEETMRSAVATAAGNLTEAGVSISVFPEEQLIAEAAHAHPIVMAYEAARERAVELSRSEELSEPLAELLRSGVKISDRDYLAARQLLVAAAVRVRGLLVQYDAIVGAAAPGAAPRGLAATGDPVLSRAWQGMGLPAVTVPGMTDPDGLPLGLQVVGGTEDSTLRAAYAVEVAIRRHR